MRKTTIYLPDEVKVELEALARQTGQSEAELIRQAVTSLVEEHRRPLPAIFGSASSGRVSGADSEEWLERNWQPDW